MHLIWVVLVLLCLLKTAFPELISITALFFHGIFSLGIVILDHVIQDGGTKEEDVATLHYAPVNTLWLPLQLFPRVWEPLS